MSRGSGNPGGAIVTGLLVAAAAWFLWARYLKTGSKITFDQDVDAITNSIQNIPALDWGSFWDNPANPFAAGVLNPPANLDDEAARLAKARQLGMTIFRPPAVEIFAVDPSVKRDDP